MNSLDSKLDWGLVVTTALGFTLIIAGVAVRPIMYIAFAFATYEIIKSDSERSCKLMFAWLGVCPIFKLYAGGTSLFTYIELIFILKSLVASRKLPSRFLMSWILLFIYVFIGSLNDFTAGIKTVIIPFVFLLLSKEIRNNNIDKISLSYVSGVLTGSVVALLREKIPNMTEYVLYKSTAMRYAGAVGFTRITRFSGLWGDPNYYAIHLVLSMIFCAVLFSKKRIGMVQFYIIYIATAALGAVTGSKSFLLMLVLVTGFVMIILAKDRQFVHLSFFGVAIIVGLFLVFSGRIDIFSFALDRLFSPNIEGTSDLSTGRLGIWKQYFEYFANNPFRLMFGTGVGNGFVFRVPHNTYIDFPAILGLVGTVLFWYPIISCSNMIWDVKARGTIYPIITLFIMIFFLSMIFNMEFVFELVLVSAFYRVSIENKDEYSNEQIGAME